MKNVILLSSLLLTLLSQASTKQRFCTELISNLENEILLLKKEIEPWYQCQQGQTNNMESYDYQCANSQTYVVGKIDGLIHARRIALEKMSTFCQVQRQLQQPQSHTQQYVSSIIRLEPGESFESDFENETSCRSSQQIGERKCFAKISLHCSKKNIQQRGQQQRQQLCQSHGPCLASYIEEGSSRDVIDRYGRVKYIVSCESSNTNSYKNILFLKTDK